MARCWRRLHGLLPSSCHGLHMRAHRRQVALNLRCHALLNKAHLQTRQGKGTLAVEDRHRGCMGWPHSCGRAKIGGRCSTAQPGCLSHPANNFHTPTGSQGCGRTNREYERRQAAGAAACTRHSPRNACRMAHPCMKAGVRSQPPETLHVPVVAEHPSPQLTPPTHPNPLHSLPPPGRTKHFFGTTQPKHPTPTARPELRPPPSPTHR